MKGRFKICSECKENNNCCMDFNSIDNPIISSEEKDIIIKTTNCSENTFTKIEGDCYTINTNNSNCPFYKNGCTIYDVRPNDCRLYPYDLKIVDGKY